MEGHGRAERDAHAGLTFAVRFPIVAFAGVAALVWITRGPVETLIRSWRARIAVEGGSMAPTLRAGDWLLVDPEAYRRRAPSVGDLALVSDPRRHDRLLVKRVAAVTPGGALEVAGDAPGASTDSRAFGPVAAASVSGRPWFRYWPPERIGRIR